MKLLLTLKKYKTIPHGHSSVVGMEFIDKVLKSIKKKEYVIIRADKFYSVLCIYLTNTKNKMLDDLSPKEREEFISFNIKVLNLIRDDISSRS